MSGPVSVIIKKESGHDKHISVAAVGSKRCQYLFFSLENVYVKETLHTARLVSRTLVRVSKISLY